LIEIERIANITGDFFPSAEFLAIALLDAIGLKTDMPKLWQGRAADPPLPFTAKLQCSAARDVQLNVRVAELYPIVQNGHRFGASHS
jgi:hypothetical protein